MFGAGSQCNLQSTDNEQSMRKSFLNAVAAILLFAITVGHVRAQSDAANQYPTRRVVLVTSGVGGSIELGARLLAAGLTAGLNQPVIIDNVPSDTLRNQTVANAQPDGYTLLYSGENLWVSPLFESRVPYDPFKDFAPISLVQSVPQVLTVHPSLPVKSVKELIALAKSNPGQLNFAVAAPSGAGTLATTMFAHMAGIKIVQIPYKSVATRMSGFLAGEVEVHIATAAGIVPYMKSGKVRILGVASEKPSPLVPGVPTIAQTLPGYEAVSDAGLFAPGKTPATIISRLNREVTAVMKRQDVRERFINAGMEPIGSSPEQFTKDMRTEVDKLSRLIKETGLRAAHD